MGDEKRRCIFHLPLRVDPVGHPSGSHIRPLKMLNALSTIGYEVDIVMGDSRKRQKQIAELKKRIKNGVRYDFVYSESSTMPTALTDSDHLPRHPFLDLGFLGYCRRQGIPVGLYYRDAYWRFSEFDSNRRDWKQTLSRLFYRFDYWRYRNVLDKLFVQSKEFGDELSEFASIVDLLPPGCDAASAGDVMRGGEPTIRLFYVGGISLGGAYDLRMLFEVVKALDEVSLTVCVREDDWGLVAGEYEPLLGPNINIVHASGPALAEYYEKADVGIMVFEPMSYRSLVMPVKLFEYLGNGLPILTIDGTAVANFVRENGLGWVVEYDAASIKSTLRNLADNPNAISEASGRCLEAAPLNSWESRARYVQESLMAAR